MAQRKCWRAFFRVQGRHDIDPKLHGILLSQRIGHRNFVVQLQGNALALPTCIKNRLFLHTAAPTGKAIGLVERISIPLLPRTVRMEAQ
ncbi:hypothetical protein EBQ25_09875 [Allofranklinella schreckenbergeri]|uniref:Uncharacterized protein n=1 Tax=Allofranklinella schreckenbergeri TaxID=1076744 RepID=A0A3M6Q4N0_9BURK|nr:hypothetical protein EBQ25_09875 [Allofranklinella schreckenbergeri]